MGKDTGTDTIHHELCTAITELAKSVDFAVKRMAIRAKFTAAIADAEKAERAAEAFLAAALQGHLAPAKNQMVDPKPATTLRIPERDNSDAVEKLDAARGWPGEVKTVTAPSKPKTNARKESTFALSLLQLHDRTGGFLQSNSDRKTSQNDLALIDH